MLNEVRHSFRFGLVCAFLMIGSPTAHAQWRDSGLETEIGVKYQTNSHVRFVGGTTVDFKNALGITAGFGYRLESRFEWHLAVDWQKVDYSADVALDTVPVASQKINSRYDVYAIRGDVTLNVLDEPITPFVSAGIGMSFIDADTANSKILTVCWWDPWKGHICSGVSDRYRANEFSYHAAGGVRWDFADWYSLRLQYQRQWMNVGTAPTRPGFDQFYLTVVVRY